MINLELKGTSNLKVSSLDNSKWSVPSRLYLKQLISFPPVKEHFSIIFCTKEERRELNEEFDAAATAAVVVVVLSFPKKST
jgi:hypothetical protein